MTIETFNKIPAGEVFAMGVTPNSPDGLYMTSTNRGKLLRWVAVKGHADDWALYTHWAEHSFVYVSESGDKVYDKKHIQLLLPCTPEVAIKYRF